MKKLFLFLWVACLTFVVVDAATNRAMNKKYKSVKLFDGATVILDSLEKDTATDIWEMSDFQTNDDCILGTYSFQCKDSTGTDSVAVTINIEGNFATGASTEKWLELDTYAVDRATGETLDADTIITCLHPRYVRFVLEGTGTKAAEKASCSNIYWSWPASPRSD